MAETWEVSDYRETTGEVMNTPHAGRTLHELVSEFPEGLVGKGWSGPYFPLQETFLDASHMLPVHLHADDETAQRKHGEPHGKTEAWHILWATEGAKTIAGVREGVDREELFVTLSNAGGAAVRIEYEGEEERLERAESCIQPASMGEARVVPEGGEASLVVRYVPDLRRDVIAPLRKAGYSSEEMRALGEVAG